MKTLTKLFPVILSLLLCGAFLQCEGGGDTPPSEPPCVECGENCDCGDGCDCGTLPPEPSCVACGDNCECGDECDCVGDGKIPGELEGYPKGLSVVPFTDELDSSKCVGFYAVVDFKRNPRLSFRPQLATAKKPTAYFADFTEGTPYITINGGYFGGVNSVSLLIDNYNKRSNAAKMEEGYHLVRAALGRMGGGAFEATWVYCMSSDLNAPYSFPSSWDNDDSKGIKAPGPPTTDSPGATKWEPRYAIGGGPMLVYNGVNVAAENTKKEVLTYIAGRNPRTAIGFTADNKLVLLVCDGRNKQGSVGFTFVELADKMLALGCTYAVNLDGGGSSTFVGREGKVLNLPSDSVGATLDATDLEIRERRVPTAVTIALTE